MTATPCGCRWLPSTSPSGALVDTRVYCWRHRPAWMGEHAPGPTMRARVDRPPVYDGEPLSAARGLGFLFALVPLTWALLWGLWELLVAVGL